jgi:release factor glutamine methyltransferase
MGEIEHLPKYIADQAKRLEAVGIESARVEMEWILCHVLDVDRLNLYLHGAEWLTDDAREHVERIIEQRLTRYPLQYILEESWFYGRKFFITPDVMVPTPETEGLCEAALGFIATRGLTAPRILDLGAGSGVIAVTMASELKHCAVLALDISEEALEIAHENARAMEVTDKIEFRQSNLFSAVRPGELFDLILSNPPYIREVDYAGLMPEVKADPKIAMTAGADGLDVVRGIIKDAPTYLSPGGRIMFEIGLGQSEAVAAITSDDPRYTSFTCLKDLNDIDRIIILGCDPDQGDRV